MDNAIFLNGVKLYLLAAACRGIPVGETNSPGYEKIGCDDNATGSYSQLWCFDPMHAANGFNTDTNNAHAQPDGGYHYHGAPNKLYNTQQFAVIGFAADIFAIMAPSLQDGSATKSSYKLIEGDRPNGVANSASDTNTQYNGTFINDYEYHESISALDKCNGMEVDEGGKTVYRYFVTPEYPWVMKCFKGEPNASFNK